MILLIDNYDSFVYNLYQYLKQLGKEVEVVRNDRITGTQVLKMHPEAVVISPGPGIPDNAGNCLDIIGACYRTVPILGICLGHQAVGRYFGGRVVEAESLYHGKTDELRHQSRGIFAGLPASFAVARYHSLVLERESMPGCLEILADTSDHTVMAVKHRQYPVYGLQFHPESIMTEHGMFLMESFLGEVREAC